MFAPASALRRPLLHRCAISASNSSPPRTSSLTSAAIRRPSASTSPSLTMPPNRINYSSSPSPSADKRPLSEPRPSASVLLLSPQNEVLLLRRVQTSSSFASAHVFPGGNLDAFHDGEVPLPGTPERHRDGLAYRLAAVRETFEETGLLLARGKDDGELVDLSSEERDVARRRVHGNQVRFGDWVASLGAVPDTDGLIPFTRWITPAINPKRFTTQMYLYLLPLTRTHKPSSSSSSSSPLIPTPDNGVEHTTALFAPASTFLAQASANAIILFPPQLYLLRLVASVLSATAACPEQGPLHLSSQRDRLLAFAARVPTAETDRGRRHATANVAWADKVMSPHTLFVRKADKRAVLALDKPGPELKDSGRAGDWERVVLVNFGKEGPTDVEVRRREDVLEEERRTESEEHKL